MSANAILGKNVTVYITIGGVRLPYLCSTSINVHFTTELIRRTSPSGGASAKYKSRMMDTTATLDGVSQIIPFNPSYTGFHLIEETVRRNGVDLEIEFLDSLGNYRYVTGHALMPDIDLDASVGDLVRDSIEFQFSGTPGVFNAPPPSTENTNPIMWNDHYGSDGEWGFIDTDLIGRSLVLCTRQYPLEIITTGTPNVQQVKFDSSTGTISFSVPLGANEYIYYQYQ